MLTKEYILENIEKYCDLDEDLCEGTFWSQVVEPLEAANCFDNWTYDSGITKGVLIFGELDYVIKIPFYCEYYEGDGYYDEEENWVETCEEGPSGYPFNGVEVEGYIHENPWDYCETESFRYAVAEKNNMEEYFAKTWLIGKVGNWPVYAQARACMYRSEESHTARSRKNYTNKERESARELIKRTKFYVEDEWLIDFINYWGEARTSDFIAFCDQWFIDDLHPGNLGYICGVPCLVDYSSYES